MARTLATMVVLIAIAAPARADAPPLTGQIEATVAPVALYPDALLTPLLMAATYPEEVTEADAWLGEAHNEKLKGDALAAALEPRPWAPSVKALAPFPVILDMMAERQAWMTQLGRAFVAAPAAVTAAVQKLRLLAIATGKLKSTPRLNVKNTGVVVIIAPPDPAVVYIPIYNPALVFGGWTYPDYPPVFIEPPEGFRVSGADIATGIGFSVGFGVLAPLWGWAHADWASGAIEIDTAAYNRINRYGPHVAAGIWHHEAHPTGYFHITQDQVTPPIPPAKRATVHASARAKAHAARHVKGAEHRKGKTTRPAARRGKTRVAAGDSHTHHRR